MEKTKKEMKVMDEYDYYVALITVTETEEKVQQSLRTLDGELDSNV